MLKATSYTGFGQNMRVLEWIIDRCEGRANAVETPIGFVPTYEDLNWEGTEFTKEQFDLITNQDKDQWVTEIESHTELFNKLGERLPKALKERQAALLEAVKLASNCLYKKVAMCDLFIMRHRLLIDVLINRLLKLLPVFHQMPNLI